MLNLKLDFLESNQIFGENQLEIFKNGKTEAYITDFAILLGGWSIIYPEKSNSTIGIYFTKTGCEDYAPTVDWNGNKRGHIVDGRHVGIRPILPYSQIQMLASNISINPNGILEVEFGEYPQTIVSDLLSKELEEAYQNGDLSKTGKFYTTDSNNPENYDNKFQPRNHFEYKYKGKKYIRFTGDENDIKETISDGRVIYSYNTYWIEVEPIKWLIDQKNNIAVLKNILCSGIQFDNKKLYRDDLLRSENKSLYVKQPYKGDFYNTDIYEFIKNYFAKDILPYITIEFSIQQENRSPIITDANISHKNGINITITIPENISEFIDSVTIKSIDNKEQVLLLKK